VLQCVGGGSAKQGGGAAQQGNRKALVPAAADDVIRAHVAYQRLPHYSQRVLSGRLPVLLPKFSKAANVNHRATDWRRITPGLFDLKVEDVEPEFAGVDLGERVTHDDVALGEQLFLLLHQLLAQLPFALVVRAGPGEKQQQRATEGGAFE